MGALFARADLDSFASLRQGGAMSDKNTPESEAKSNGVAIACYVLAIVFLLLALFGYGRLHESWPPEIDGSVQKCLIIALVLFLIPSAKEMNIAGVLSFKAKVEEAKKEAKEAKGEVKEAKREFREIMQIQSNVLNSVAQMKQEVNVHNYTGPKAEEGVEAIAQMEEKSADQQASITWKTLRERVLSKSLQAENDLHLGQWRDADYGSAIKASSHRLRGTLLKAVVEEIWRREGNKRSTLPFRPSASLRQHWRRASELFPGLQRYSELSEFILGVSESVERGEEVPWREALLAQNVFDEMQNRISKIAEDPTFRDSMMVKEP